MGQNIGIPKDNPPASAYNLTNSPLANPQQKIAAEEMKPGADILTNLLAKPVGIATISTASGNLPTGVSQAVADSKPSLSKLSSLEQAFLKDPESMMLYVGEMQTKLMQKGIVGAQGEIESNMRKSKIQREIKQDKLEEQADELRKAQEAQKKAGVFGKLAGAFGITGGALATALGVVCTMTGLGAPIGIAMMGAGVAMMASSSIQTASPETYQKILEYSSFHIRVLLEGMGMSENDAKMAGMAMAQFGFSLWVAGGLGPAGSMVASIGGGVASGAAQVGMAASDIKAAGHQRAADELKAESEKFSKILALNKMDEETIRKFMKTMMDDINTILDTVMSTLQDTQASKQTIVNNLNQAQTV